jgi:hypothetical protein
MATADLKPIDVICQHSKEGKITPIKIRVVNEDGENQEYRIKGYRDLSGMGTRTTSDGVYVKNDTLIFECSVVSFGRNRTFRLYYDPQSMIWRMSL